ncbi:LysR family transcriptional regulator [Thalassomonas actiniarum]|uniref:LysR family transcriptional regulator n=1 Tax=Thalassomonas actiniarum TaxID=485447 RepID=A0AAF0C5M5_9GAMM|nr:LysR family transcriptional regulator [Thalassomonas actiniarum]WDE01246.1 LysR family transcriptional regulator [Thalassomonas actiniarum]
MYNIEQLNMLVHSAELGSFSACARKLGKVQSAISQGIANLEIDLDVVLFDRSTRKPTLTRDGERIYTYAKAVLHQVLELEKVALATSKAEEPIVKLAFDSALFTPKLSKLLQQFSEHFPHTGLEVITVASTDIASYVESGKADIGIIFADLAFNRNVDLCFIGNLSFYGVCHPQHVLSSKKELNAGDLIPHRQLLLRGEHGNELQHFAAISATLWWANSFDAILALVKQNIGWAYLPRHMVASLITDKQLHQLPMIFDHKPWNLPVDVITAKGASFGPALNYLFEGLKAILE